MKHRIGTRLLVGLGGLFALLMVTNYAVQELVTMAQFRQLERAAARDDLRRCRDAIVREIDHLSTFTRDWASWDDPYLYLVDRNKAFEESNLSDNMWKTADRNLLYYLNANGEVVWGGARDLDYETPIEIPTFPRDRFPPDHELLAHRLPLENDPALTGVILTSKGAMIVCARPVLTSQGEGPARGTLITGRLVSDALVAKLREQTRVNFRAAPLDASAGNSPAALDDLLVEPISGAELVGQAYVGDPRGRPILLIEAAIPREISAQGAAAVRMSLLSMLVAGVLACGLIFGLLQAVVVRPLEHLTDRAAAIGRTGDLAQRIGFDRDDEIGTLAREFDDMIQKLGETRAKLLDTSRGAGMADVASSVLHNVGNVLNSVNVSTLTMTDAVRKSKVTGLTRAAELLEKNRANLADFIANDERGRNLPTYLAQLAQTLADEQRAMLSELGNLKTSVDHVNQIVQSQHSLACKVGHVEPTRLRELVGNSLAIMEAAFKRHGIRCEADLVETPTIQLDSAKCLQVVVNLLTNAKEALGASDKGDKRLDVGLRMIGDEQAVIEIRDNGVGIAAENLERIFGNGFTTKASGRGFGLHYCALAAKELGGELSAYSDGPGRGATFALRLPLRAVVETEASAA